MAKNKLLKIVYKDRPCNQFIFYGDSFIEEQDVIISEKTSLGYPSIGIVINSDVDPNELNECGAFLPIKQVFFLCKSTHDLSSSRNAALKAILGVYDIGLSELLDTFKEAKKIEKNSGLPF